MKERGYCHGNRAGHSGRTATDSRGGGPGRHIGQHPGDELVLNSREGRAAEPRGSLHFMESTAHIQK